MFPNLNPNPGGQKWVDDGIWRQSGFKWMASIMLDGEPETAVFGEWMREIHGPNYRIPYRY